MKEERSKRNGLVHGPPCTTWPPPWLICTPAPPPADWPYAEPPGDAYEGSTPPGFVCNDDLGRLVPVDAEQPAATQSNLFAVTKEGPYECRVF